MTNLLQFEPFVDTCVDIMMTRMAEFAAIDRKFDLQHWLQWYCEKLLNNSSSLLILTATHSMLLVSSQ